MTPKQIIFDDAIAQNYDDLLGPFVFEPFAIDLVERLNTAKAKNVLELACGTGRVTRQLAQNLPIGAKLTATDLNPGMIAVARQTITATAIEWQTADMSALPFEDNHFDSIVCQFGIMFVPNKLKALQEMRRVLKKDGQLLFNTWGAIESNPAWQITSSVVKEFMGDKVNNTFNDGPFSMHDEKVVLQLLDEAGFNKPTATAVYKTGQTPSTASAAKGFIEGLPIIKNIREKIPHLLPAILEKLQTEFTSQLGGEPLKTPLYAWAFHSTK